MTFPVQCSSGHCTQDTHPGSWCRVQPVRLKSPLVLLGGQRTLARVLGPLCCCRQLSPASLDTAAIRAVNQRVEDLLASFSDFQINKV